MGGTKVFYVSPNTRGQRFIAIGQADDTSEWMSWPILASLDSVHWEKKFSSGLSTDGVITWKSFVPVTLPLYRSPVWLTAKIWGGGSDSFGPNCRTPKNQRFSHAVECSEQMFRGREKSPLCEWCGCHMERRREVTGNKNRLKGCVGGQGAPPNPCVPADNYLVSSESSIYCAGALTGKQEMSSWLPIVIEAWRLAAILKTALWYV